MTAQPLRRVRAAARSSRHPARPKRRSTMIMASGLKKLSSTGRGTVHGSGRCDRGEDWWLIGGLLVTNSGEEWFEHVVSSGEEW